MEHFCGNNYPNKPCDETSYLRLIQGLKTQDVMTKNDKVQTSTSMEKYGKTHYKRGKSLAFVFAQTFIKTLSIKTRPYITNHAPTNSRIQKREMPQINMHYDTKAPTLHHIRGE